MRLNGSEPQVAVDIKQPSAVMFYSVFGSQTTFLDETKDVPPYQQINNCQLCMELHNVLVMLPKS